MWEEFISMVIGCFAPSVTWGMCSENCQERTSLSLELGFHVCLGRHAGVAAACLFLWVVSAPVGAIILWESVGDMPPRPSKDGKLKSLLFDHFLCYWSDLVFLPGASVDSSIIRTFRKIEVTYTKVLSSLFWWIELGELFIFSLSFVTLTFWRVQASCWPLL